MGWHADRQKLHRMPGRVESFVDVVRDSRCLIKFGRERPVRVLKLSSQFDVLPDFEVSLRPDALKSSAAQQMFVASPRECEQAVIPSARGTVDGRSGFQLHELLDTPRFVELVGPLNITTEIMLERPQHPRHFLFRVHFLHDVVEEVVQGELFATDLEFVVDGQIRLSH